MLQVDLDAPDSAIEQFIEQSCSKVGRVVLVTVHRSPSPFALIEMTRREQVHELTSRFGGSAFGTQAIVPLDQMMNKAIPTFVTERARAGERRQLGDRRNQRDRRMAARPAKAR